jgi:hypothetical protein
MIDLNKLSEEIKNFNINLTEEDILNFLKNKKRWPMRYPWGQPSIEIINNLSINSQTGLFDVDGFLNYENFYNLYELGYTSVISSVLDLNNELRELNKYLHKKIGSIVNANFYFSKGGQTASFKEHQHDYAVIVKQIYGIGYWKINRHELILEPQKSVLLPAECPHEVFKIVDKKLSLTINIT